MAKENLAAVVKEAKARCTYEIRPIPKPGANELVVRNHAIAANPVDWKIQDYAVFVEKYPNVLGSDVAGIVEEVGSSVSAFKPGDRVCGYTAVIYNQEPDHGAFQTYSLLKDIGTSKIPDSMSFVEGSVFPMAVATAGSGLFITAEVSRPSSSDATPGKGKGLVIWGAASSVGVMTIQIAKDLGFTIFGTASPTHHDYLKSLGAHYLVDYRDSEAISKLVTASKDAGVPIELGYDTISTGESPAWTAEVVSKASNGKGGKVVTTLPFEKTEKLPAGVQTVGTGAYANFTSHPDAGKWLFNDYLQNALTKKTLVPAPKIEVIKGGIKSTQKVWDQLKAGVSGQKLVIEVE